MKLEAGTRLGRYQIISKIGEGGMGEVYLAEDTSLQRRVALKFINVDGMANEQANKRFLREAQTAARLDHPNICTVHEVAEENGRSFIVMQYVEGETLDHRLKQSPLTISESLSIASLIANALAEAHDRGIIHRDIKPANIITNARGDVKVMDFGLARLSNPLGGSEDAPTQTLLTTPGVIIGTVPYMSPEQVHGRALDNRTDVFSFGVMLYEMLTGRQPFASESAAGIMSAILTREPPPLSDFITNCPSNLQNIIDGCLAKDRDQRYQSMRNVATDLKSVQGGSAEQTVVTQNLRFKTETEPKSTQSPAHEQRPIVTRRLVNVLAVIGLAIVILGVYAMSQKVRTTDTSTTSNSQPSDTYLQAKVLLGNENREDAETAIKLLESTVEADPNQPLAWCQLARAYNLMEFYYTPEESKQLHNKAQFAIEKALSIDPNLADAHFVRGLLLWSHANRFPHDQAIQAYKQALALDPNLDEAHHQLGLVYFHIGLLDKGWAEIEKAVAINPSNTLARFRFGVINLYRGNYEDSLRYFNSTPLDKNPSLWAFQTATALFQLDRNEEALNLLDKYLKDYPKDEGGLGTSVKAMIFAKTGKTKDAELAIAQARQIGANFGHFHHTAYNIACAYALMNKPDETVQWLETAADDGFPCYPLFAQDKNLDAVRKNQKFVAFMAKLKRQWERYNETL